MDIETIIKDLVREIRSSFKDIYRRIAQLEMAGRKSVFVGYSEDNVSDPPSDTEIDSVFGTPAEVGIGYIGIINDAGADTNVRVVASDGSSWWYTAKLTKAV